MASEAAHVDLRVAAVNRRRDPADQVLTVMVFTILIGASLMAIIVNSIGTP